MKIPARAIAAALSAVLLGTGCAACGSGSATVSKTSATAQLPVPRAPVGGYIKYDGDKDQDDDGKVNPDGNDDQYLFATYPQTPTPAERQAIGALVKRYYAAAAAEEGAKDCPLLYGDLATSLAQTQGGSCAKALSLLFEQQHRDLTADEVSTMVVIGVHMSGNSGLAVMGFRAAPESELVVQREGATWKVDALIASEIP